VVQDVNYASAGKPPGLGSTVRLNGERSDSKDRVLKLLIEGLSVCLIVESLRRRVAEIAGKRSALALGLPMTRLGWRRRSGHSARSRSTVPWRSD
jgi:hypothetical protein